MNEDLIKEICSYLVNHINEDINIEDLETFFHYNKFYLIRNFKEYTGYTIIEFINNCRIYNSIDPLIYTDDTILKIALSNGFKSQEYYSEKFKDIIEISPLKFRQLFHKLNYLINKTNEKEELNLLKYQLNELNQYKEKQNYLNNINHHIKSKQKIKNALK